MAKTLEELAKEALDVQSAGNLHGVVHSFAHAMVDLRLYVSDTLTLNTHPIVIIWADKVAHLAGIQTIGHEVVMEAFRAVREIYEPGSTTVVETAPAEVVDAPPVDAVPANG